MKPLHYAAQIAYSSKETLMFTYEMAVKYKDTPGVYVECGVAAGAQIIAMAYGAPNKTIYAFDSFCGIPLPSNRDDQMPGIALLTPTEQKMLPDPGKQVLETSGATAVSEGDFWEHLWKAFDSIGPNIEAAKELKFNRIIVVKGWFEISIPYWFSVKRYYTDDYPEYKGNSYPFAISILRLDGDLYNSTLVCLQHLFPKVIQGGCVIIDDWTLPGCQAACKEYFDLIGYEPNYQYLDGTAYFYK